MTASALRAPQSIASAVVDLAVIAAFLLLARWHVTDPSAWMVLSALVGGRFGIAAGKLSQRSADAGPPSIPPPAE